LSPAVSAFNESAALPFLKTQQSSDGSFDAWFPPHTALAAIALNGAEANSSAAWNASAWMIADLQNSASWSWAEADIPGTEIYSLALTGNANASALSGAYSQLLSMQAPSGGFIGWWTSSGTLEDAASTSFSVLGLNAAGAMPPTNATLAKNYLLSLQNADGTFNLTTTIENNSLSSLAPNKISATAIALLALQALGENSSGPQAALGLSFLKNSTDSCFGNESLAYSAAASALAFDAMGESAYASKALNYLKTLQKSDGSFLDSLRSPYSGSALDTGTALHAFQKINETSELPSCLAPLATPTPSPTTSPTPTATPSPTPCPTKKTQEWAPTVAGKPWIGHFEEREVQDCGAQQAGQANGNSTAPAAQGAQNQKPITVKIDFPASSAGKSDKIQEVSANSCSKAYECFSLIASITCNWGSLGCFVAAVDGVQSHFEQDGSWWSFKANGNLADTGVSYYDAKEGDTIELAYVGGQTSRGTPATQSSQSEANSTLSATSSPTSVPSPTSPKPTAAPTATPAVPAPTAMPVASATPAPTIEPAIAAQATQTGSEGLEMRAEFYGNESALPQPATGLATSQNMQSGLAAMAAAILATIAVLLFVRKKL
jgi:hypothetical protein